MESEERAKKDKESVDAMKRAQSHMSTTLKRVSELEDELNRCARRFKSCMEMIPENSYGYDSKKSNKELLKGWIIDIKQIL